MLKQKQKPQTDSFTPMKNMKKELKDSSNSIMQKLFGVPKDWYKHRDIVKNNYLLGLKYFRLGQVSDSILRFKLVTWFNKSHVEGWYFLGRSYLMAHKRAAAERAFQKALSLEPSHANAKKMLAVVPLMFDGKKSAIGVWEVKADGAHALAHVHQESFLKGWTEKEFTDLLAIEGTKAWINGLSDLPMGMIVGRSVGEQYEILTLAVIPDWRQRGLAKQLLEKVVEHATATGAHTLFLEVSEENSPAWSFYEKAGFTVTGRRKGYYRQPDGTTRDALVMQREMLSVAAA